MTSPLYDRLGPITTEPRKKFRITYQPGCKYTEFVKVMQWDDETRFYVPVNVRVRVQDGEYLDYFVTPCPDTGNPLHVFARQLDTKLFILNEQTMAGATKEPGKGNDQNFWLQEY